MNALKFPPVSEAPGDPEPPEVRAFSRNLAEDLVRELLHQVALRLATPPAPAESAALQAKAPAAAGPLDEPVKGYRKRRNAHRFWSYVKKGEAGNAGCGPGGGRKTATACSLPTTALFPPIAGPTRTRSDRYRLALSSCIPAMCPPA